MSKRQEFGLTDAEREVRDERRRFRNLICLGVALVLVGLALIGATHWRNWP